MNWPFLQKLADARLTPFLNALIGSGAWAPTDFPLRNCPESGWMTVATGVFPDRHGILHALERLPGSVFVRSIASSSLKCPALWHQTDAVGMKTAVIGWPATLGLELEHGLVVACGAEMATGRMGQAWPLHPQAVSPQSHRETVRQLRLHPDEIRAEDVEFLLSSLSVPSRKQLFESVTRALAESSTLHAIGTYAVTDFGSDITLIRLPFLSAIAGMLSKIPYEEGVRTSLARCYQFMDLLCGRYQNLLGHDAQFALISNGGMNVATDPKTGRESLARGDGFLILNGPLYCRDVALGAVGASDLWPTLAEALGLATEYPLDGDTILDAFDCPPIKSRPAVKRQTIETIQPADIDQTPAGVSIDTELLTREGIPLQDFSAQIRFAQQIECETRLALAHMQCQREYRRSSYRSLQRASLSTLRDLSQRFPGFMPARVFLAEQLLWAGDIEECEALVQAFPLVQAGGLWADVAYGLIAFARKNWIDATDRFARLAESDQTPINARAWLGWIFEARANWPEALRCFKDATEFDSHDPRVWESLGEACRHLGRFADAAEAFGRSVSLNPRSADLMLSLSNALEKCGQTKRAASIRLRAMRLAPRLVATSMQKSIRE
jgi:tetratricopeptide (TPR) repeat protein